jgi:hypothetical protein
MGDKEMEVSEKDWAAYKFSIAENLGQLITVVEAKIGLGALARYSGMRETRAIREWRDGLRTPRLNNEIRLRFVARVVHLLDDPTLPYSPGAWLSAPNPNLNEAIPGEVVGAYKDGDQVPETQLRDILEAAKDYLQSSLS